MYRLLTALLCFVSMLAACGSAGGDIRPHESDQREEAAARAQLAAEVRRQVRATSAETGVADLDDGLVAAIAEVPRHAFLPDQLRPFAYLDIPLPLTRDQNVAQPSLMALMTQLARIGKNDVVFETGGVKVIVDPESLRLIDGTEVDFVREGLNEAFRFRNPNVKGECGCGESFNV